MKKLVNKSCLFSILVLFTSFFAFNLEVKADQHKASVDVGGTVNVPLNRSEETYKNWNNYPSEKKCSAPSGVTATLSEGNISVSVSSSASSLNGKTINIVCNWFFDYYPDRPSKAEEVILLKVGSNIKTDSITFENAFSPKVFTDFGLAATCTSKDTSVAKVEGDIVKIIQPVGAGDTVVSCRFPGFSTGVLGEGTDFYVHVGETSGGNTNPGTTNPGTNKPGNNSVTKITETLNVGDKKRYPTTSSSEVIRCDSDDYHKILPTVDGGKCLVEAKSAASNVKVNVSLKDGRTIEYTISAIEKENQSFSVPVGWTDKVKATSCSSSNNRIVRAATNSSGECVMEALTKSSNPVNVTINGDKKFVYSITVTDSEDSGNTATNRPIKVAGNVSGKGSNYNFSSYTPDAFSGTDFIEVPGVCSEYNVKREGAYSSYTFNGASHNINLFSANDTCDNTEYYAFCYDPNKSSPGAGSLYGIQSVVNPFDDIPAFTLAGDGSKLFEGFVYYIYQKYAPQDGQLDNDTRAAIQMAMRVFWTNQGGSFGNNNYTAGYYSLAVKWTCEFNGDSQCVQANGLADVQFANSAILAKTREIYFEGMRAANTCAYENCSGLQSKVGVEWSAPEENTECETEGNTLIKKVNGQVIGLAQFNDSYILEEMICPAGLTCELYINDGLVNVGADMKGMADGKYMIKVKGTHAAFSNANGKVGIRVKTKSTKDFHNILAIRPKNTSQQRMVIFLKGQDNVLDIELIDVASLTCGGCNIDPTLTPGNPAFNEEAYKEKCCNDPNADPELCPPDDAKKCVAIVWNIVCGADGEVYTINEGIYKDTGKLDYEKCIINYHDAANNTYVANGAESMPREGNRYCTVSCKEDWEFEMPGNLGEFDAGRYFLLNISRVKGSRTCVTGTPNGAPNTNITEISNDKPLGDGAFQADLEAVNKEIVEQANLLAEAKAWLYVWEKGYNKATETKKVSCGFDTLDKCFGVTGPQAGVKVGEHEDEAQLTKRHTGSAVEYTEFQITQVSKYDTHGKLTNGSYIIRPVSRTTSSNQKGICNANDDCGHFEDEGDGDGCTSSCWVKAIPPEEDFGLSAWQAQKASAEAALQAAIAERNEMIKDIKECSNWSNNFHYEPEISYTYAENDYMNMIAGNNQFRITGGGTPSASIKEESYRNEESKPDDYEVLKGETGGKGAYLNTENIFTIDTSNEHGLFTHEDNPDSEIPYTSSIKIVSEAEYSYEIKGSWYTIHDSGAMQYEDGPETGYADKTDGDTTLVENGKVMPISINTPAGQYEYQLRFVDVGQYNDSNNNTPGTDNLGRLIGGDNDSHTGRHSVFSAMQSELPEIDQTYLCYYSVVDHNPCATKIKTEIVSLLDCPDATNCPGYLQNSAYIDPNGDVSFFTRSISLNDMNPTGRTLGENWTSEEGASAKAAIESKGDEAFAEEPEYSFTLNPTGMASVRALAESTNYGNFENTCDENGDNCTNSWIENLSDVPGVTVNQFRNN